MAEGFEEGTQETNGNRGAGGETMDAIAMVGAVIPKCDSSPQMATNSITAITTSSHNSSHGSTGPVTPTAGLKRDFITESAKIPPSSPSPNLLQPQQQQQHLNSSYSNQTHPINLKSEVGGTVRMINYQIECVYTTSCAQEV